MANDTEYGPVGYVFTEDLARGQRLIDSLDTGTIGVTRPFRRLVRAG